MNAEDRLEDLRSVANHECRIIYIEDGEPCVLDTEASWRELANFLDCESWKVFNKSGYDDDLKFMIIEGEFIEVEDATIYTAGEVLKK